MAAGLSVSDVVNVQIVLTPTPAALRNFGVLQLIGASNVIDTTSRVRNYSSLDEVAADFPLTSPEYLAADLFFSQKPQPTTLNIGRWAKADTHGQLNGAILNSAQQAQLITTLQGVTNGSIRLTIDGTVRNITGLNFSSVTNLNGAASLINAQLTGGTIVWAPDSFERFIVTSASTGTNSTVGYAAGTGTGTDLSTMLGLTQASGASVPINGITAETPVAAMQALTSASLLVGGSYGFVFADTSITDQQHIACAAFAEAANPVIIYGVTTQEAAAMDPTQTTDLASQMKALGFSRTFVQYSSFNPYAVASVFGRAFTVDFTANNSTITLMWKNLPGVQAETLNETQAATLKAKNANVYVNYANGTAIEQNGVMASGMWFDVIYGTDWLQNDAQTDVFNLFYTSSTKVPQTNSGVHLIVTTLSAAFQDGVNNGLIAPGVWNADGFGSLQEGQMLPTGYYIYAPDINSQSETVRATRVAPTLQCAIKLGGAIHAANVIINVNQ